MNIDVERERLSQKKILEELRRDWKLTDMLPVYLSNDLGTRVIYGALIPAAQIEQALSRPDWDLMINGGMPDAVEDYQSGRKRVEYLRYGANTGVEPLIICRRFSGLRDPYLEISEEFRLFHRLYHDRKKDEYIKIDAAGNESQVAIVEPHRVQIRLKEIRQFLAIKEMYLALQFDWLEESKHSLAELGLREGGNDQRDDDALAYWRHNYLDGFARHQAYSRVWGKRLVAPLPKSQSGFGEFAEEPKKYVEFIIDVDENGEAITYTSNPDALANYFGANSHAPNYVTPVHFQKQVLEKYYRQPRKYSVGDSILSCGDLWYMRIDNHHQDKVCAWLGDLGQNLSYNEQLHWRTYNIPPEGAGISETYWSRQFQLRPMNSDQPDLLFKQRYQQLQEVCNTHLGWQLLLPLDAYDEHHLQGLRIPATDEQRDFDELVLSLTKILIDSLHQKRLKTLLPAERKEERKGSITYLEAALSACGAEDAADHISFLRNLQKLRSRGVAHRKGSDYQKTANDLGIEYHSLQDLFTGILWQSLDLLNYFINFVRSGRIHVDDIEQNKIEEGYAVLDELVGFVESDVTDASVNHDKSIYELRSTP